MDDSPDTSKGNRSCRRIILALAGGSAVVYGVLALAGDLRDRLPLAWTAHALLTLGMIAAWRLLRSRGGRAELRWALGAALAFRLVAAAGEPALSDDVYRYVWDGRVQNAGLHPYAHAPDAPELEFLRDADWARINHRSTPTIYPAAAQGLFAALAAVGAGPGGFRLFLGLADFAAVLGLLLLLIRLELPLERVLFYAWNPLAVMESSGSGHIEPVGVALAVLAVAWTAGRRPLRAATSLAVAVQTKLLPLFLFPALARRWGGRGGIVFVAVLAAVGLPLALTGPAVGAGLFEYAGRWSRNAVLYPLVLRVAEWLETGRLLQPWVESLQERFGHWPLPWDFLWRHVWPPSVARLTLGLAGLVWVAWLIRRPRRDLAATALAVLGGLLLLSPTLHPWYLLWLLPFAAARLSWPWLLGAALVPLGYAGGTGDVPSSVRLVEYAPPLLLAIASRLRRRRGSGRTSP